jgi:integrase
MIARGIFVRPNVERIRFDELVEDLEVDYRVNGYSTFNDLKRRLKLHILPRFSGSFAASITRSHIMKFIAARQEEGASPASINRELSIIKRCFSLGFENGKVITPPKFGLLPEHNARSGFFEVKEFRSVLRQLSGPLRPMITFAYITGWRIPSEVLLLEWRQVDFAGGLVRLDSGSTKERFGRVFPFTTELRTLFEEQRSYTDEIQKDKGIVIPWVFHRNGGRRIRSFRGAWATACKRAGLPGKIPHDFRRTAVRNLVRAGVPERVAMAMTGHRTRAVFDRYNIVSEGDLKAAASQLDKVTSQT